MSQAFLSPEECDRLAALFERAADLPRPEQAAFVERECGPSGALHDELARLLEGLSGEDLMGRLPTGTPSRAGAQIGPYKLLERVGDGGMGEVYAAEQQEPIVRKVALKIIKPGMDSAQVLARFSSERHALARLSHPNIAQVFDGGTTGSGSPYFVMEFVEGESITDYCDRHRLSTSERIELFRGVCAGVQHAHLKGIIHRDLKPSNVLVTRQDGRAIPKVIDFGVARATSGQLTEHSLHTMLGQVVGTLDYMSPEQADPIGTDVDTRSDIYSLGVLLYQLLTGLLPFEHQLGVDVPLSEIQRILREKDPPTPSTRLRRKTGTATAVAPLHGTNERALIRQLSGDLDWICMKALEKEPSRRYQSAFGLSEDLRRHLAHQPVLAGRPGMLYRSRKFARRHRVGVTAGALVAVAAAAVIFSTISGKMAAAADGERLVRLADSALLAQLVTDAQGLWPAQPGKLTAMNAWLESARGLDSRLPAHDQLLRERAWNLELSVEKWHHSVLEKLVEDLTRFRAGLLAEDATTPEHGWSVPKRIAFASKLRNGFSEGGPYAQAWAEALPAIRAAYKGLDLKPQLGLVPVGADPTSHLWEFAHLQSGEPAVRGPDGKLLVTEEMGIVLVLIPGGTFWMGAQKTDPSGHNYDPQANDDESPVHAVELSAYFLSKYEMTQGQWLRFVGRNPSYYCPGTNSGDKSCSLLNPVEQVTWSECTSVLACLGLVLPTEAQWECGARAGSASVWWTGDDKDKLQGAANLADSYFKAHGGPGGWVVEDGLDDGWTVHARVGSYRLNAFGLHDVIGNVWEWCRDGYGGYDWAERPGDGERQIPGALNRVNRGGSFYCSASLVRSAFRRNDTPEDRSREVGVRPARAVTQ